MNNISIIFEDYVKDLKLSVAEDYIYVVRDDYFGDIVFSVSQTYLRMIKCDLSSKYFNKMISVNVVKGKTIGYEYDIGVLEGNDFINHYNCTEKFRRAMRILNQFKHDLQCSDIVKSEYNVVTSNESFYNDILLKKADDGAGRFICGENIMYLAPCMLPGSKSTEVDIINYYKTGNDYYTTQFITHKKTSDILTFMKFICL